MEANIVLVGTGEFIKTNSKKPYIFSIFHRDQITGI